MTWYLILIAGIAILFYAAFPAIGAFLVRSQWRLFRNRVTAASRYPTASPLATGRERSASVGYFRFFGSLEAIQGDDTDLDLKRSIFRGCGPARGTRLPDSRRRGKR